MSSTGVGGPEGRECTVFAARRRSVPGHVAAPGTYTPAEMRSTTERELKLAGGAGFRFSRLPGEPIADRTFVSTYHDTPGLSLAGSGITLRHRVEGRSRLWQMKLPRADVRVELEVEGNGSAVPAEIASLLVAHLRHGPLTPIAALRT